MKLLHIENSSGRGGSLKSLKTLWPAPAKWQVEVVALERPWSPEASCDAPVTKIKKQSFFKAWRMIQKSKADVVHVNNAVIEAWSFVLAAWWEGVPVISHFRTVRPLRKVERLLTLLCHKLLVLSEQQKESLPTYLPKEVIRNGIPDIGEGEKIKSLTVGMFSVLKKGKAQEDVLEALSQIDNNWHCHVVGGPVSDQPSTEPQLRQLVKEKNIADKVTFHGHVDNPHEIMQQCLMVVDPSHKAEGFRRTVSEGAMMARAVRASDVGGARDLLTEDQRVKPGDIAAWKECLIKAFQSTDNLFEEGRALRVKALEMFDQNACRQKFWQCVFEAKGDVK